MTLKTAEGETIPQYLARMANAEHRQKGDDGLRTTREVAEYFKVSMARARRNLHALWESGQISAYDAGASGHQGNPIFWAHKAPPPPVPAPSPK